MRAFYSHLYNIEKKEDEDAHLQVKQNRLCLQNIWGTSSPISSSGP